MQLTDLIGNPTEENKGIHISLVYTSRGIPLKLFRKFKIFAISYLDNLNVIREMGSLDIDDDFANYSTWDYSFRLREGTFVDAFFEFDKDRAIGTYGIFLGSAREEAIYHANIPNDFGNS
ncbi:hypothetical protein COU57_00440 [Candidatus Pacearchaeota archaeon CG10_big_fil_rev_8_21_14_0_10_32_14]|nr:MAG: hypothetical protein COU57_00440 [Candidatus Pacearchaeota archaeon CG10_big_fil_rev_8_21_14_0_10_32_14]